MPEVASCEVGESRMSKGELIDALEASRREIGELQRQRDELARLNKEYEAMLHNTPIVIWAKDRSDRYVFANRYFAERVGLSRGDIVGKTDADIFTAEFAEFYRTNDHKVFETGLAQANEAPFPQVDGLHIHWSTQFPLGSDDNGPITICGISTDISELKETQSALEHAFDELEARVEERTCELRQAKRSLEQEIAKHRLTEEALRESQEILRAVIDTVPAAINVRDRDGGYAIVNKTLADIYDLTTAEAERLWSCGDYDEATDPYQGYEIDEPVERVFASGKAMPESEQEYELAERLETWWLTRLPIFDASGQTKYVLTVGLDVSERKQREKEIRTLNAELERRVEERTAELESVQEELLRKSRLAALGQLTGTVSHELRNPLGALRTAIASIKRMVPAPTPLLQQTIGIADRSVSRCDEIITDLLEYSRVRPLNSSQVDLDSWLSTVLDTAEMPAGISLARTLRCGLDLPIDRERLRRAVINVFDNACQAISAERTHPAAAKTNAGKLTVATETVGERVELRIADNGCGMDETVQSRLFEPLYSTKSFGVGLGMTVVKQILEQHSGGVEIVSAPGQGTEVVLWMPNPHSMQGASA